MTWDKIISNLGALAFAFWILSIFYRRKNIDKIISSISLIMIMFILLISSGFIWKWVPSYRFFTYLAIFLPISTWLYFSLLKSKQLKVVLIFFFITLTVITLSQEHWRDGFSDSDYKLESIIRSKNNEYTNTKIISFWAPYYALFPNGEWDPLFPIELSATKSERDINYELSSRYWKNVKVLIVASKNWMKLLNGNGRDFLHLLKNYELLNIDNTSFIWEFTTH